MASGEGNGNTTEQLAQNTDKLAKETTQKLTGMMKEQADKAMGRGQRQQGRSR
ncbi:MAG TPA: hypothetical protein VF053_02330 [Streptosporangiales bacterium]